MPLWNGQMSIGQPRPSVQKVTFSGSLNSVCKVAAICSMVTPWPLVALGLTGGRDFHGSIYEFARRYQLNANSFSSNARGTQLTGPCAGQEASPRFTRDQITCANLGGNKIDQYGFVLSGPAYLPHFGEGGRPVVGNRDKSFFLVNVERYKELTPGQGFSSVPTLLERGGRFDEQNLVALLLADIVEADHWHAR